MGINASKVKNNSNANSNRVEQVPLEPGVYPARLVQVIDLGVQPQNPYQGKEKAPVQEIMLTYEFVDEFMKDEEGNDVEDKPRWYSETIPLFSLEADLAKSTKRYLALDPDNVHGGDFGALLGTPCNVTLVHNKKGDKLYVNIVNVGGMRPKDVAKCPELKNPTKVFDLDNPDLEVLQALPKWIQEKIQTNLNFKGSRLEEVLSNAPQDSQKKEEEEDVEDDAPF